MVTAINHHTSVQNTPICMWEGNKLNKNPESIITNADASTQVSSHHAEADTKMLSRFCQFWFQIKVAKQDDTSDTERRLVVGMQMTELWIQTGPLNYINKWKSRQSLLILLTCALLFWWQESKCVKFENNWVKMRNWLDENSGRAV